MAAGFDLYSVRTKFTGAALAAVLASAAIAQAPVSAPATPAASSAASLNLPETLTIYGKPNPSVVKATVIINGEIITQSDVDHRVALLAIANGQAIPTEELERVRIQVLRNLIDETLQIQAAKAEEITVAPADIDRTVARVAGNVKQTPEQMADYLKANGSSIRAIRRQIEGETAWTRLQRARIESQVSVGDDEVKAVIDKLNASKGTQEFRVGEIFLASTQANQAQTLANANRILEQLKAGASFAGYARQFSEASTAAVGGDLGWVRPEQLPDSISAALRTMTTGQISPPIPVQGGYSIIAIADSRKVLTADPRDALLSLKQISVPIAKGTTQAQAEALLARFTTAVLSVGGCGGAEAVAAQFNGEVVQNDQVKMRDLPPVLQQIMIPLQVGQATQPFGGLDEGLRTFVICGRDEISSSAPSYDQVFAQLNEERINLRARRYLRDLRRDAVIDFR